MILMYIWLFVYNHVCCPRGVINDDARRTGQFFLRGGGQINVHDTETETNSMTC